MVVRDTTVEKVMRQQDAVQRALRAARPTLDELAIGYTPRIDFGLKRMSALLRPPMANLFALEGSTRWSMIGADLAKSYGAHSLRVAQPLAPVKLHHDLFRVTSPTRAAIEQIVAMNRSLVSVPKTPYTGLAITSVIDNLTRIWDQFDSLFAPFKDLDDRHQRFIEKHGWLTGSNTRIRLQAAVR